MGDDVKKTLDDAKDTASEIRHRTKAEVEKAKREITEDDMSTSEKLKSVVDEDAERAKAEIDKAKREVRDKT